MGSVQTTAPAVIATLISVFCVGLLLGRFVFDHRRGKRARLIRPWRFTRDLTDIGFSFAR